MKPMMALSITFASPVAMKPPRSIAAWIWSRHCPPTSARRGNQSRNAARSLGTHLLAREESKGVLAVHGRNEIREKVMEKLASGHDLGLPLPPVRAGSHRGRTPRLARRDGQIVTRMQEAGAAPASHS